MAWHSISVKEALYHSNNNNNKNNNRCCVVEKKNLSSSKSLVLAMLDTEMVPKELCAISG